MRVPWTWNRDNKAVIMIREADLPGQLWIIYQTIFFCLFEIEIEFN
jgi:hypothetical protein